MRLVQLLREARRDARRQVVPTLLLFIVSLGATLGALLTAGQQVAQREALAGELNDPSARVLAVREATGKLLNAQVVQLLRTTRGVESVIGVGEVLEVDAAVPGAKTTAWQVTDLSVPFVLSRGRSPADGEAAIDEEVLRKLGWEVPSGVVLTSAGREFPVVAGATVRPGYEVFAESMVVQNSELQTMRSIVVMADAIDAVPPIQAAIRTYAAEESPGQLTFESSGLAIVDRVTSGDFASYTKSVLLTVIGLGSVLTTVVSLAYVLLYRRLLGRRRALGITRIDLTALTLVRVTLPIALGAALAGLAADVVARVWLSPIPPQFTVAVALVMVLTSSLTVLIPIAWAVNRDPVAILRTA
ncbi:hypothetical protein [Trueperella bernardiae]|uniref:hypothetical protein n=1 Tax=Trueperella bernardiae TaxID=59561 RepID=UPI00288A3A60|nr:hypothetical protein [Trueperella bernardiae]